MFKFRSGSDFVQKNQRFSRLIFFVFFFAILLKCVSVLRHLFLPITPNRMDFFVILVRPIDLKNVVILVYNCWRGKWTNYYNVLGLGQGHPLGGLMTTNSSSGTKCPLRNAFFTSPYWRQHRLLMASERRRQKWFCVITGAYFSPLLHSCCYWIPRTTIRHLAREWPFIIWCNMQLSLMGDLDQCILDFGLMLEPRWWTDLNISSLLIYEIWHCGGRDSGSAPRNWLYGANRSESGDVWKGRWVHSHQK